MSGSVHLSFYEFGDFAFGMLIFRVLGCYYVALYLTFVLVWIYYCLYLFRTRARFFLFSFSYGFTPRYVEGEITRKPCESRLLDWFGTLFGALCFGLHWSSSPDDDDGTDDTNTTNDI